MKKFINKNNQSVVHRSVYEKRIMFKIFICIFYLIAITILALCIHELYEEKFKITPWSEVESTDEYTSIKIFKMSEAFAYYEKTNKEIHFVIEQEDTGLWHTYLIAIDKDDYDKYKNIIDYTYERTTEVPEAITVYGYPVVIDDELKQLAISNINNFVPKENEVVINNDNFNTYLTNSYLDTTIPYQEEFSILLCFIIIVFVIVILMFILTIFDKDKVVYRKVGDVYEKKKKKLFARK